VKATGARSGMAVTVDVTNGDVLAMASVLGASPTGPAKVAGAGDHNAPLTDLFEPGSTNKLITLSWAIEHGHIAPDTMFEVPYSKKVDPHVEPYYDAEPHVGVPNGIEHWTTADILRESSNVGTIMIAQKMKNQEVADGVRAFGLGQKTAIEWPGQPAGLLLDPSHYYATGKYSTAIARLDIQVEHAMTVCCSQALDDLRADLGDLNRVAGPFLDNVFEGAAGKPLHHDKTCAPDSSTA